MFQRCEYLSENHDNNWDRKKMIVPNFLNKFSCEEVEQNKKKSHDACI